MQYILTLSFFFLSGVMKPFLAFLALEASSRRARTSALFLSVSACFLFFSCINRVSTFFKYLTNSNVLNTALCLKDIHLVARYIQQFLKPTLDEIEKKIENCMLILMILS